MFIRFDLTGLSGMVTPSANGVKDSFGEIANSAHKAGNMEHPTFFRELMDYAQSIGVSDCLRIFGLVPYDDVAAFMQHALAVINPSLFEGWSSTVEEAKSFGKKILLSDIAVHREQALLEAEEEEDR